MNKPDLKNPDFQQYLRQAVVTEEEMKGLTTVMKHTFTDAELDEQARLMQLPEVQQRMRDIHQKICDDGYYTRPSKKKWGKVYFRKKNA